jgi:Putative beta-barrel porin-2, OmpL-like. bbp2
MRWRICFLACVAASANGDEHWYDKIQLNGFASVAYEWNFNRPQSNTNQYRIFDFNHNTFGVDVAELVLQKPAVNPGDFGFRVDFTAGMTVPRIAAARGLFRDTVTGQGGDFDLQQAFGSYIVPVGRGLRVDIGKFVTPVGYEVIEGFDGFNDQYSRSFMFGLGMPFTHIGMKISYSFTDKIAAMVMVANGWDVAADNNAAKSFGAQLALTPSARWTLLVTYLGGPERDNDDRDFRHFIDLVAQWRPHWRVTAGANLDWGFEQNGVAPPAPMTAAASTNAANATHGQWMGAVLYLRVMPHKRFAINARGEAFWDRDGLRSGTAQLLWGATLTPEFRVSDWFILRAEGRIDVSDQPVFERFDGGHRRWQPTLALNAVYLTP